MRTQLPAERQAVLARQHQIEHDQVHRRPVEDAPHLAAVGDGRGAKLVLLEILTQQRADLAVVIDDEEVGTVGHRQKIIVPRDGVL